MRDGFVSRHLGYGTHPHHDDHFSRGPGFPTRGSHPHFGPRHLNGSRFSHRDSRPTRPSGELLKTMKTSSGFMVKCWIHKIYLTNPNTEPLTSSRPM
jgi:hypothetical protein